MSPPRVLAFELNVSQLEAMIGFFVALGFRETARQMLAGSALDALTGLRDARAERVTVRLGDECIHLTAWSSPSARAEAPRVHANDHAFQHAAIVVRNVDEALAQLSARVKPQLESDEPQTIPNSNPVAGGVRAVYLRTPDAHFVELIAFPPNKGERRWQRQDSPFLGIDHTAIVCSNTERSLAFYRDELGFRVAATSLNEGVEQARLTNVKDARVRVTSLRGGAGPGVELLEFLEPRNGKPLASSTPADLAHWEITISTNALTRLSERLPAPANVSPEPIDVRPLGLGYAWARLCVDPDGHTVRLVQEA